MPSSLPDKLPPQNLEAEQSLLGSLLTDREAIHRVVDMVTADNFYLRNHQLIWGALMDLSDKRENIDILSVSTRLKDMGQLDAIGGVEYLTPWPPRCPQPPTCKPTRASSNAKRLCAIWWTSPIALQWRWAIAKTTM